MSDAVVTALITGAVSLIGTILTVWATSSKTQHKIDVQQAVTEEKITELTREVREHNDFGKRIPAMQEKISSVERRLDMLERKNQ